MTLHQSFEFSRSLQILNGQSIRFYSVTGSSLSDIDNLDDNRFAWLDQASVSDEGLFIGASRNISLSVVQKMGDKKRTVVTPEKQNSLLKLCSLSRFC